MFRLEYPCSFVTDDSGGDEVALIFPDVPEAITGGANKAEALALAEDCLSVALTFYLEAGKPLPKPSKANPGRPLITPNLQISLKAALHDALRESGRRPADLARLVETDLKSAKRLLDPNHSSGIPALEQALARLGKRVVIATVDKPATTQQLQAA